MKRFLITCILTSLTFNVLAEKPTTTFDTLLKGSFGVEFLNSTNILSQENAALIPASKVQKAYYGIYPDYDLVELEIVKGSIDGKGYWIIPNLADMIPTGVDIGLGFRVFLETNAKEKIDGENVQIVRDSSFSLGIPTLEYVVNETGDFCSDGFANATITFKYPTVFVWIIYSNLGHFGFGENVTDDFPCDQEITFTGSVGPYSDEGGEYYAEEDLVVTFE